MKAAEFPPAKQGTGLPAGMGVQYIGINHLAFPTKGLLTPNNSIPGSNNSVRSIHLRLLSDTELTDDTDDEEERSLRYHAQLHERARSQPSLMPLNDDERIALLDRNKRPDTFPA